MHLDVEAWPLPGSIQWWNTHAHPCPFSHTLVRVRARLPSFLLRNNVQKVWELCKNTVKVTSLDTTTDSNTREKLPYEADGYITGGTRHAVQRDSTWQRHSSKHNIRNPTWPTEWRQIMSLMAYDDYMQSGSLAVATDLYDTILENTMIHCLNSTTNLIDFTNCNRDFSGGHSVRDITDWPADARDGYQMTDIGTVINAYFVACMKAMAAVASGLGRGDDALRFAKQANATAGAMRRLMIDTKTGLYTDTVSSAQPSHSAWHSQVSLATRCSRQRQPGRRFSTWRSVVAQRVVCVARLC